MFADFYQNTVLKKPKLIKYRNIKFWVLTVEFMNNFEATLLFSPDLTAKKIESIENFFEKQVKTMGGSLVAKENWWLRDLSYKINNTKKAFYNFYHLNLTKNHNKTVSSNYLVVYFNVNKKSLISFD